MEKVVVVPLDGSEMSFKALTFAISIAEAFGDALHLVHVKQDESEAEDIFNRANTVIEQTNLTYTTKVREGIPSIEIADEAKEQEARLIVMGSLGMNPQVSVALGSVSQRVLPLAPCPVTLVS